MIRKTYGAEEEHMLVLALALTLGMPLLSPMLL
jgi:hypothetical protein